MQDEKEAKARLNRTLGTLHKAFEMVSVYVTEHTKKEGMHYHVGFMFFEGDEWGAARSQLEDTIKAKAFAAWSRANNGKVVQSGNRLKLRSKNEETIRYFCKEVEVSRKDETATLWSGARPNPLIQRHQRGISKNALNREVREMFNKVLGTQLFLYDKGIKNGVWDSELFKLYKNAMSAQWNWKGWKFWETFANPSDKDFFEFLKSGKKVRPWDKVDPNDVL